MDMPVVSLYMLTALTGLLRLSMFGTRMLAVIALAWGAVMWGMTLWLSGAEGIGSMPLTVDGAVMACVVAESMVFFALCVSRVTECAGRFADGFLRLYPGLMLWLPLSAVAVWLLVNVTSVPFDAVAVMAGAGVSAAVFGLAKMLGLVFRYEDSRVRVLYVADVAVFLLCVVLSGL